VTFPLPLAGKISMSGMATTMPLLGLMETGGVVRVGIAHYNTMEEVDRTLEVIADSLG